VHNVVEVRRALLEALDEVRPWPNTGCEHEEAAGKPGDGIVTKDGLRDAPKEESAEERREDGE
jgi:hypothetical protein